jgi:hypothetical protein
MTEQIGVTYLPVVGGTYHMALFYENGDGQKQVIEVAPQHNLDELSAGAHRARSNRHADRQQGRATFTGDGRHGRDQDRIAALNRISVVAGDAISARKLAREMMRKPNRRRVSI